MTDAAFVVPARFNGPATSGNGGYVAGRLASFLPLDATVQVTLRRPPPLEIALEVQVDGLSVRVTQDDAPVAEAAVVDDSVLGDAVPAVDADTAREAMTRFEGRASHPFPTCFVCGPRRPHDDGLGLFAGPLADVAGSTATVFVPRTDLVREVAGAGAPVTVGPEMVWAALDCPGGWAIGLPGRPAVLGRMAARVSGLPSVGERCVVVGQLDRWDGRKAFTRTTAYGADGRELGRAAATWIELS